MLLGYGLSRIFGQQFFRYVVFLLAHCDSGQVGSLLPKVRLHKILHTLHLPFGLPLE